MTDVRVELFDTGSCRQSGRLMRRRASWSRVAIPSYAAAVVHPTRGVIVVDTGYAQRFLTETTSWPQSLYRLATPPALPFPPSLAEQLAVRAIHATEVRHVVVTHAHADHLSGLLDFPRARIHQSGRELPQSWQTLTALQQLAAGRLGALIPPDLDERLAPVETAPVVATELVGVPAGWDVLGDGTVLAVPLPGHTPGHIGVYLPSTQGSPVLLIGDAAWHRDAFVSDDLPPGPVMRFMHDAPAYVRTVGALAEIHRHHPEVAIVPAHCADSVRLATAALR